MASGVDDRSSADSVLEQHRRELIESELGTYAGDVPGHDCRDRDALCPATRYRVGAQGLGCLVLAARDLEVPLVGADSHPLAGRAREARLERRIRTSPAAVDRELDAR